VDAVSSTNDGEGSAHWQQFEALHTRWSRTNELLEARAVSADLDVHLARTRDVLASRMRELNPHWAPPALRAAA